MSTATTAAAPFIIDSWDEQTAFEEEGLLVYRTHLTKRFSGDLDGESVGDMIMVHVGGKPTAYCGFERVTGSLAGRRGSFGLSLTVVPGSGTAELRDLSGSGRIDIAPGGAHIFTFEYELD